LKLPKIGCFLLFLTLALAACHGSHSDVGRGSSDFYGALQADALSFAFDDGEWLEDFGDAAAFGPAFYLHAGLDTDRKDYLAVARAASDYNLRTVWQASRDIFWYLDHMEEVFMSTMGLIEYAGVSGGAWLVAPMDDLICTTDRIVRLLGDYVNVGIGEFAADLFGPTSITAGIALIYLQYATYLDTPARQRRIERAAAIVDAIDDQAWNIDHYRFSPGEERLFLYPNAIMLSALSRLYELTGEARYLERAETVYGGIQPLHDVGKGFYRSPYSQEFQEAKTDEYSTLSSQNYLMLGLMLLYRNTGDARYINDVLSIIEHVRVRLYDSKQGKLLHHWIDGRIAHPDDPDYFCSGCNLQTLYILWYLQSALGVSLP